MNDKTKILFMGAMVAGLWLSAPGTLKAQSGDIIISGTVLTQGHVIDNGSVTVATTASSFTTASILKQLTLDENATGNWGTNKFPAGTKLICVFGSGFQVIDEHNNLLLAVSTNVLSLNNVGQNSISYGAGSSETSMQLATLTYDATSIGGTNNYIVTGLGTTTTKTTNPNALGNYTQAVTFDLQNGTGEGVNTDGVDIVLEGVTITANGSANLNNGEGDGGGDSGSIMISILVPPPSFPPIPPPIQSLLTPPP